MKVGEIRPKVTLYFVEGKRKKEKRETNFYTMLVPTEEGTKRDEKRRKEKRKLFFNLCLINNRNLRRKSSYNAHIT